MNNKRNRRFVVGLLIFTLLLTGVYALLATNLNITGTATGTGDFKVEFTNVGVSDEDKATAVIDSNKTSINIEANLSYPGDSVTISFTIKNTGSLKATVSDLRINENSNDDINITINGLNNIIGTHLDVNETTNGTIVVTWNAESTNPTPETVNFSVNLDYIQTT